MRSFPYYSPSFLCKTGRSFQRKNATCQSPPQSKHVTKKRGNKCGKVGGDITNYLNHLSPKIDILCLQEHKLRGDILDRISKMLWRLDAFWSREATPSTDTDDIKIGTWRGGVAIYFHTKVWSLFVDEGTLVGK